MIQILACNKVYVTPEMKRKKLIYKIYFILSVFLVLALSSYCIYAEYDRNKSEMVSQEILEALDLPEIPEQSIISAEDTNLVSVEDNVIVVVLNDSQNAEVVGEIRIDDLIDDANIAISENSSNNAVAVPRIYKASNGVEYHIIAIIRIPKLGLEYPVLSEWDYNLLKNAVCKFHGADPNQIGNFCMIGHNYKNNKFFSQLVTLEERDIIQIQDMSGRVVDYAVYKNYVVEPDDTSCTTQETNGKKEITLITCYNNGKQRTVIKATALS